MNNYSKIWTEAIQYALKYLNNNPWDDKHNSRGYVFNHNGKLYPPKRVLHYAVKFVQDNYPDTEIPVLGGGKPTNRFLESFGFNIEIKTDYITRFDWIETHKEICNYLSNKQNNQEELVEVLKEAGINVQDDKSSQDVSIPLKEIDPFTFFCHIYKHGTSKRLEMLQKVAASLDIKEPTDESGIPSANAQKTWLFPYKYDRKNNEIGTLWDLFFAAQNETLNETLFSKTLEISGVGKTKLTESLFTIKPLSYFPLNGPSKPYIKEVFDIDPEFNSLEEYQSILARIKGKTSKSFPELSYEAWLYSEEIKNTLSEIKIININEQKVFKISMGKDFFNDEDIRNSIEQRLVLVHSDTKPKGRSQTSQADIFNYEMGINDFFYLTHSNKNLKVIGKITSNAIPATFKNLNEDGWLQRKYELIAVSTSKKPYTGKGKYWTPNTNVTCWEIKSSELESANDLLFKPFFKIQFIRDSMEHKFKIFLEKSLANGTVKTYLSAIRSVEKLAQKEGLITESIYKIEEFAVFKSFWDELKKIQSFVITNEKHHNRFSSALLKYEEFLSESQPSVLKSTSRYLAPLNQLFYGPPGTGKTYHTVAEAASIIKGQGLADYKEAKSIFQKNLGDRIEFITFHQNYSYEDFIQGLRPDVANKSLSFERTDGIFKKIATKALFEFYKIYKKEELENSESDTEVIPLTDIYKAFIASLQPEQSFQTISGNTVFLDSISNNNIRFKHYQGGQTYVVSEKRLIKLFSVFDDISKISNINDDIRSAIGGSNSTVYYVALREFIAFKKKLEENKDLVISTEDKLAELQYEEFDYDQQKEALSSFDLNNLKTISSTQVPSYVIIIDEINRANISRVFGELITLIEPDKRSHGDVPLTVTLPSGERFIVPSNLYIIGTMNTADKSIALLDIALRRRFEFIPMYPDTTIEGVQRADILNKINEQITSIKTRDFTIGHSYFMGKDFKLDTTINNKVIPLLLEYFMNDEEEVIKILKEAGLEVGGWPLKLINELSNA